MRTLVTGGVKAGKSSFALELAKDFGESPKPFFLATARPFDDEMRIRVARHKAQRGQRFITIEEPIAIDEKLRNRCVVDCLPMWLNNLFYDRREAEATEIARRFVERLPQDVVIVTNEIGLGIIPADPITRQYEQLLAIVNAQVAEACDRVVLMVCGIPLAIKGRL